GALAGAPADAQGQLQGPHAPRRPPRRAAAPGPFLSARAAYGPGKAIRGGVPLIFPWFGPHATDRTKPMHGFARARSWRLVRAEPAPDGTVGLELALDDDEATRAVWSHAFRARYRVTIGDALGLTLEIVNASRAPF